jgi:NAD(P)H-dependent FMN reductase
VKRLAALSGSLRKGSLNVALIELIGQMGLFEVMRLDTVLPPFTPDEADNAPPSVLAFRKALNDADAILIATPEYAMGVPGVLKNAIDWTVGSCEFAHKPTALITCTASGEIAHPALLEILRVLEAKVTNDTIWLMNHNRAHISADGQFRNAETETTVRAIVTALLALC